MRTWAVILLVIVVAALAGGTFYAGRQSVPPPAPVATTTPNPYADTAAWQTYANSDVGFSIAYPLDFATDEGEGTTTDWRVNASTTKGREPFVLSIPKAFEPQTNFADAKLTIGESDDDAAVAYCLVPDPSGAPAAATTTKTIGATTFTVFTMSDAGAGNRYETTSYRTIRAGACYAIEYTIHSTELANYPASYHLSPFDEAKVKDVLDRIVGTFAFK